MFSRIEHLPVLLEPTDYALERLRGQQHCDECGVIAAPLGINDLAALAAWLRDEAPKLGNRHEGAPRERPSVLAPAATSRHAEDCAVCVSQIEPAIGIPDRLLLPLIASLSSRHVEFLRTFVIGICGVCRLSPFREIETGGSIVDRFVRVRLGGNKAFLNYSEGREITEIAGLIDQLSRAANY